MLFSFLHLKRKASNRTVTEYVLLSGHLMICATQHMPQLQDCCMRSIVVHPFHQFGCSLFLIFLCHLCCVHQLAASCLNIGPHRRPRMKDVCTTLEQLKAFGTPDGGAPLSSLRALLIDDKSSTAPCPGPTLPLLDLEPHMACEPDECHNTRSMDVDPEPKAMPVLAPPAAGRVTPLSVVRQASGGLAKHSEDWVQFEDAAPKKGSKLEPVVVLSPSAISEPGISTHNATGLGADANVESVGALQIGVLTSATYFQEDNPTGDSAGQPVGSPRRVEMGHDCPTLLATAPVVGPPTVSLTTQTTVEKPPGDNQQGLSP